jgi:thiamine-phosphate pyrophosphorylase
VLSEGAARLCLCTGPVAGGRTLEEAVEEAVSGGVTMVQLREKTAPGREFYRLAVMMRRLTKRLGVPLIINDRADIALASGADGVHLGQTDLPVEAARRIMGSGIIGVSAGNAEEAEAAWKGGADYIGAGAVYPTPSKADAGTSIGLETLREICDAVEIPVMAIGGICAENAPDVIRCGASGIAVISAVLGSADFSRAARELAAAVSSA